MSVPTHLAPGPIAAVAIVARESAAAQPYEAGARGTTWGTVGCGRTTAGKAVRPGRMIVRDFAPRSHVDFEPAARAGSRRPAGGVA